MPRRRTPRSSGAGAIALLAVPLGTVVMALSVALLALLISVFTAGNECGGPGNEAAIGPPGGGQLVGATEYGGPGDPGSGTVGASGANLLTHPDSYAELGGYTFQTATSMGGLPYMTPLQITWGAHSAIGYKRDFGFGGGRIDGLPRVIDLWWELAGRLGIPYQDGGWAGPVRIARPPASGAGNVLGQSAAPEGELTPGGAASQDPSICAPGALNGVPVTSGDRAHLLPSGRAAAPQGAPMAVKEIIGAGNEIVGKPYLYGGGHGTPLNEVAPSYDCSSSVEHLLYGGGLLPVTYSAPSGTLESFGLPGPGQWVTLYANPDHVFMYVAGLRWDTYDAAGSGDGSTGIGWHALIRSSDGFLARHPAGL